MPDNFSINIPTINNNTLNVELGVGQIVFVLGANGTGKSSLVSHLYRNHSAHARRISAHRQTWFTSNTIDITPKGREDLETNFKSQDTKPISRHFEWNPEQRANIAIFDLIDADTMLAREIADLMREEKFEEAKTKAEVPAPIFKINELMRLSNIPIEITIEEKQKIMAVRDGGAPYSIAALSDGERNAFLIAALVITAPPGTLLIIDEPERHLHRTIISPLLTLLFETRDDCAFIVSTHELGLPVDNPNSQTLLVRSCEFNGVQPVKWDIDLLPENTSLTEKLKTDLLGGRRKLLFIEGTATSIDLPIYSLLFPSVSIIPKSNCREVENSVKALRTSEEAHWTRAWGIVDNDRRSSSKITELKASGVFALSCFSVESLYYNPEIISRISVRMSKVAGGNPAKMVCNAISAAIDEAQKGREHLIENTVTRLVRQDIFSSLPTKDMIKDEEQIQIAVKVAEIRKSEEQEFDTYVKNNDLTGLLNRYPLRESGALTSIANNLSFPNKRKYQAAVLTMLQDKDSDALALLSGYFSGLVDEIT